MGWEGGHFWGWRPGLRGHSSYVTPGKKKKKEFLASLAVKASP